MRTNSIVLLLLAIGLNCPAAKVEANDKESIAASIDRGVAYLKREQNPDGSWSSRSVSNFDLTPLCTLALLNSGVPPDDDHIQRALKYLRTRKTARIYTKVEALATMVFCRAEPERDADRIKRSVALLVEHQYQEGKFIGGWHYCLAATPRHRGDPANTEWALLALDYAHSSGIKIEQTVWRNALQFWLTRQNVDGSWRYSSTGSGTGSMTCAGLASILIIKNKLQEPPKDLKASLDRGMKWLEKNFTVRRNAGSKLMRHLYHSYYLYGLSRTAKSQNIRLIRGQDWYQEAAKILLEKQNAETGAWKDHLGVATDTSFALLFLSSGDEN